MFGSCVSREKTNKLVRKVSFKSNHFSITAERFSSLMLIRVTGWENPEQLRAMETDMKTVLIFSCRGEASATNSGQPEGEGRLSEEPAYKEDLDV